MDFTDYLNEAALKCAAENKEEDKIIGAKLDAAENKYTTENTVENAENNAESVNENDVKSGNIGGLINGLRKVMFKAEHELDSDYAKRLKAAIELLEEDY